MSRRDLIDLLVTARGATGLTQAQLAALCKVSSQQVSRWERGSAVPGRKVLPRLAEVLRLAERDLYVAAVEASQQETRQVRRGANELIATMERFVETYQAFHAAYEQIGIQVQQVVDELAAVKADVAEIKQAVHRLPADRRPGRT